MKSTGEIIKEGREQKGLLLRQVAAALDVDPSLLSKIEHGDKRATKEQIEKLAAILDINAKSLMLSYLSDKVVYQIREEELASEALKVAEKKINYFKKHRNNNGQ